MGSFYFRKFKKRHWVNTRLYGLSFIRLVFSCRKIRFDAFNESYFPHWLEPTKTNSAICLCVCVWYASEEFARCSVQPAQPHIYVSSDVGNINLWMSLLNIPFHMQNIQTEHPLLQTLDSVKPIRNSLHQKKKEQQKQQKKEKIIYDFILKVASFPTQIFIFLFSRS